MTETLQELTVKDAGGWRSWLVDHHTEVAGVWLSLAKKGHTEPTSLTYDQALEEALCFGWIDGLVRRGDDATYGQRFTPRRKHSRWSQRNCALVERLIQEKRMHPAGLAEIRRAKESGRWDAAYAGQASIEMPADFAAALKQTTRAQAMFDILTSQNRYALLYRIANTKRAAMRTQRIEQFVAMLARGETIHPQRRTLVD